MAAAADRIVDNVHISTSARKKSKKYSLSVDFAFEAVIRCLELQHVHEHGVNWVGHPPLLEVLRKLHHGGSQYATVHSFELWKKLEEETVMEIAEEREKQCGGGEVSSTVLSTGANAAAAAAAAMALSATEGNNETLRTEEQKQKRKKKKRNNNKKSKRKVKKKKIADKMEAGPCIFPRIIVTVNGQRFQLVAGEIGYCVGNVYTSLSGFCQKDRGSAGTVQCLATASLLNALKFRCWDLGMSMEYKLKMGAKNVPREVFLKMLREEGGGGGQADKPRALLIPRLSSAVDGKTMTSDGQQQQEEKVASLLARKTSSPENSTTIRIQNKGTSKAKKEKNKDMEVDQMEVTRSIDGDLFSTTTTMNGAPAAVMISARTLLDHLKKSQQGTSSIK